MTMQHLGLATLVLLISACSSTQVLEEEKNQTNTPTQVEKNATNKVINIKTISAPEITNNTDSGKIEIIQAVDTAIESDSLIESELPELLKIRKNLLTNISNKLDHLTFDTSRLTSLTHLQLANFKKDEHDINKVQANIKQLNELAVAIQHEEDLLKKRIEERKINPKKADLIQVYVSETTVAHSDQTYKTLPLVGEWTRGESRTINVKDQQLFNSQSSEKISISFTENYNLLINGQAVLLVDPSRLKKQADFQVSNIDRNAIITGQIDYKLK
ncbi:hypothetical protein O1D97_02915 [Marinomonas sp. 15G1-11]|uniref:Lipoprotein n=1 Tax=Marinomonas phaeophyticola TaxID=3004091 RepID=A0ABT4JQI2_9GAMM|nr:hypothetical protein [Marinomonas sp. 15G1-11]MCZ2720620.1 hypothetical protein [Marinomonas sp. 15G1-11]